MAPAPPLDLNQILAGLKDFRDKFQGHFWLEVFLIEGVNTHDDHIARLKEVIAEIQPERVQLNSAVRPTAEAGIAPLSPERLQEIRTQLGLDSEIITAKTINTTQQEQDHIDEAILALVQRHPCCLTDICTSLSLETTAAESALERLSRSGQVNTDYRNGLAYYRAY